MFKPNEQPPRIKACLTARSLERIGQTDLAVQIYEQLISEGYLGALPYERLAITYRKQRLYEEEIRVLQTGILVHRNTDPGDYPHVGYVIALLEKRMKKAYELFARDNGGDDTLIIRIRLDVDLHTPLDGDDDPDILPRKPLAEMTGEELLEEIRRQGR